MKSTEIMSQNLSTIPYGMDTIPRDMDFIPYGMDIMCHGMGIIPPSRFKFLSLLEFKNYDRVINYMKVLGSHPTHMILCSIADYR